MAFGLSLWVSWILFLLLEGSSGLPANKGYGYQYTADLHKMEDEESLSKNKWETPYNEVADHIYKDDNKPSFAQQSESYTPGVPELASLHELRTWGLEDFDKLLSFSLSPKHEQSHSATPQPDPIQLQSSLNVSASNSVSASLRNVEDSIHYPEASAYYDLAQISSFEAVNSHSFDSWQPEPVSSGYGLTDFGFGSPKWDYDIESSANGDDWDDIPRLIYEDVFEYPSENTVSSPMSYGTIANTTNPKVSSIGYASKLEETLLQSYPANVGPNPVYVPGMESLSPSSVSEGEKPHKSKESYQLHTNTSWVPQKVTGTQKVKVSVGESEILPLPNYIQSKDGYEESRVLKETSGN